MFAYQLWKSGSSARGNADEAGDHVHPFTEVRIRAHVMPWATLDYITLPSAARKYLRG